MKEVCERNIDDCPWDCSDWHTVELDPKTGEKHIYTKTHHYERINGEWTKHRIQYSKRFWQRFWD